MALPTATAPLVMLLLLVPTGCSGTGGTDQGGDGGGGCFAPLIGCAPPAPAASATGNATAFHASLAPLLAALPSAAAEGFAAALRSQPDPGRRDRAHALGLCFGFGGASDCHACLRAAVAAASEGCANDTRRAGVWSDGCLLAYYADYVASSASDGGTRSYADSLEQTLADLAMALAQPKRPSLWRKAQSIMSFVLAAIGAVTVVVLACFLVACYLLGETLFGNMAAAGRQAGIAAAGQGDGLAVYIAGMHGQAQVWSLATQFRFH